MSGLFGRLRSGAGWAAFEAERLRRITSVQSVVKSLREETEKTLYRAGQTAFALYRENRITEPELRQVCDHLAALQAQIIAREREMEAIHAETYIEAEPAPKYGHLCPNGHGELAAETTFCHVCGARAIDIPRPPEAIFCPNCGKGVVPGARFCSVCGATFPRSPAPAASARPFPPASTLPPVATLRRCPDCGEAAAPGVAFCANCGHHFAPEAAAAPDSLSLLPGTALTTAWRPLAGVEPGSAPIAEPPGEEQPVVCTFCGAEVVSGAAFCADCGQPVKPDTPAEPPA